MPVGTRSRKRLVEGAGDQSKKKSDAPTQKQRRRRGQKATDADVGGSGEDSTATASSSLPVELVSCDRTQASAGSVAETQNNTTDSTAKAVKARGSSGKKRKIVTVTDEVANVRTKEKDDSEMESAVILEKNMGEVFLKVMEAYKKETIDRHQIKGKPKSGRSWKTEQTARFSELRKDRPLKTSWERKMAQKAEKLSVRKFQQELKDTRRQEIELKKQRRADQQKRKEENQKKSEIVQVIKNSAKLKRMRKKQLRYIEKR